MSGDSRRNIGYAEVDKKKIPSSGADGKLLFHNHGNKAARPWTRKRRSLWDWGKRGKKFVGQVLPAKEDAPMAKFLVNVLAAVVAAVFAALIIRY
jgi:hypothetical protein